jgi:DNA-directed RNA polymerase specialized sigma24 family protein
MTRDGHSIEEAIEMLRTNHKVAMSDTEIHALWDALPRRAQTTLVGEEAAREVSAPEDPAAAPEFAGRAEAREKIAGALTAALASLAPQDQLIIQLHFSHGVGATELARHFTLSKATLHRRIARILADLRAALQAQHVDPKEVVVLLQSGTFEFPDILESLAETLRTHGRLFSRDE